MTKINYYWQHDRKGRFSSFKTRIQNFGRWLKEMIFWLGVTAMITYIFVIPFGVHTVKVTVATFERWTAPTTYAANRTTAKNAQVQLIKLKGNTTPEIMESISRYARLYNVDEKLMLNIIECESRFQIEAVNTKAKVGVDKGLAQINTYYHEKDMKRMGLDIHSANDNVEYMAYLMSLHGTSDYKASRHCWSRL